ncbi:MAG TPA: DUF6498-containing protein [Candidatus Limnocylindrales bacterium]|nr:DUF6498-containing protein [Candidatus Limnocylindrales bacterium]
MRWLSAVVLVAVNVIPLIGVAYWDWSLMMILVLYWIESGIIGVINVFKIARAEGPMSMPGTGSRITIRLTGTAAGLARGGIIGFFILHYGMFWAVHGVFVFLLPVFAGLSMVGAGFAPADFGPLPLDGLLLSALALAASHVVSFFVNFLGRREYLGVSPQGQMMSVYGRVVVLHVTVLGGAFLVGLFGTPFAALVLLVVLKTAADLFFHLREHRPAPVAA